MNKLFKKLDPKLTKICVYASITVILTVALLLILSYSGGFWQTLWNMFRAVLTPVITGFIICYLFLPLVNKIEGMLSKEPKKWTRPAAVAIFYVGVAIILGIVVVALFFAVKGGIDSIRDLNFEAIYKFLMEEYKEFAGVIKSFESEFSTSNLPLGKVGNFISRFIGGIAGFFSDLMFGVIFSIYFMLDQKHLSDYWGRVIRLINGDKAYGAMQKKQTMSSRDISEDSSQTHSSSALWQALFYILPTFHMQSS